MKFHYTAAYQTTGKLTEGEMDAQSVAQVLEFLASKGLRPISLKKEQDIESGRKRFNLFESPINIEDKIFITKYLALMLKIGTDLFHAIDILIADFDKPSVRLLLYEIRENLEKGQPFYVNFERHPKYFSSVFINLVKAGEASGNLEKTFLKLSTDLQKDQELRQQIRSALVYPILLLCVSFFVVIFLVTFALPKVSTIFTDSGFKPPLFSKIVFAISGFLNDNMLIILPFLAAMGIGTWQLFKRVPMAKEAAQKMSRRLPALGPLLKEISLQRFAATLSSLLSSGIPILDALNITSQVVGDEQLKTALTRISKEGISKGLTIGEAFKKEPVFPKTVTNLMAISEKSGNLSEILMTLADFYESEIKSSIKILVSFLEPLLLVIIGAIVGVIALAVIVPIYQLVGSI